MSIVDETREKLEEYGIEIHTEYPLHDSEHLFMVDNMLLFVNTEENEIGVSFQAETRPRKVANSLLIVLQIESLNDVDIMESFVIDENNKFISGEKAFEAINKKNQYEALSEMFKEQAYTQVLLSSGTLGEC